jgi:hypothetical protein
MARGACLRPVLSIIAPESGSRKNGPLGRSAARPDEDLADPGPGQHAELVNLVPAQAGRSAG